jgi:hypothetical protein
MRVSAPYPGTAILVLVGWYLLAAAGYVGLLRRRAHRLIAQQAGR